MTRRSAAPAGLIEKFQRTGGCEERMAQDLWNVLFFFLVPPGVPSGYHPGSLPSIACAFLFGVHGFHIFEAVFLASILVLYTQQIFRGTASSTAPEMVLRTGRQAKELTRLRRPPK